MTGKLCTTMAIKRLNNIRKTLEFLLGKEMCAAEIAKVVNLSRSCINEYIRISITNKAAKIVGQCGPGGQAHIVVTATSQDAIDEMIRIITPTRLPKTSKLEPAAETSKRD